MAKKTTTKGPTPKKVQATKPTRRTSDPEVLKPLHEPGWVARVYDIVVAGRSNPVIGMIESIPKGPYYQVKHHAHPRAKTEMYSVFDIRPATAAEATLYDLFNALYREHRATPDGLSLAQYQPFRNEVLRLAKEAIEERMTMHSAANKHLSAENTRAHVRITGLDRDLTDLKIQVAKLESPAPPAQKEDPLKNGDWVTPNDLYRGVSWKFGTLKQITKLSTNSVEVNDQAGEWLLSLIRKATHLEVSAHLKAEEERTAAKLAEEAKEKERNEWKTRTLAWPQLVTYEGREAIVRNHKRDRPHNHGMGWVSITFKEGDTNCVCPTSLTVIQD